LLLKNTPVTPGTLSSTTCPSTISIATNNLAGGGVSAKLTLQCTLF
jgi:hypothetical protein